MKIIENILYCLRILFSTNIYLSKSSKLCGEEHMRLRNVLRDKKTFFSEMCKLKRPFGLDFFDRIYAGPEYELYLQRDALGTLFLKIAIILCNFFVFVIVNLSNDIWFTISESSMEIINTIFPIIFGVTMLSALFDIHDHFRQWWYSMLTRTYQGLFIELADLVSEKTDEKWQTEDLPWSHNFTNIMLEAVNRVETADEKQKRLIVSCMRQLHFIACSFNPPYPDQENWFRYEIPEERNWEKYLESLLGWHKNKKEGLAMLQ